MADDLSKMFDNFEAYSVAREVLSEMRPDPTANPDSKPAEARAATLSQAVMDLERALNVGLERPYPEAERKPDTEVERKCFDALYADSMIAHYWFAKHFGEVMNGRDFAVKCEMADRALADRHAALEDLLEDLIAAAETFPVELEDYVKLTVLGSEVRSWRKRLRAAIAKCREVQK